MRIEGYKLNAYDATYKKTYFDVQEGVNTAGICVLEVEDVDAGIKFIFEYDKTKLNPRYVRRKK